MEFNKKAYELGSKRSVIREMFEYSKTRKAEIGEDKVFDFSLGNPSVAPPEVVEKSILSLISEKSAAYLHGYTSAQGDVKTRMVIAEGIKKRFGINISAENIYMTCGAASSLTITLKALLNDAQDEVIVFAPFFTEYKVFIENAGGKMVVSLPEEDSFQVDVSDLCGKINSHTRAVIINSPNNPSGVVYSESKIKAICELLKEKSEEYGREILLISDEPYRDLVYDGVNVPYVMNYYSNSVVCYSYSKALSLPGERIGYIAVNPDMSDSKNFYLAVCGAGRSLGYVCAPSLFQHVIELCDSAAVDVSVYKENRDILYKALTEYGFCCVKPDGAFYLFVKSPEPDAYSFYEKAKEREILVVPCDDFGVKGYVRIAYCVDKKVIENSLPHFLELGREYNL